MRVKSKTAGIADILPLEGRIKAIQEDGAEFTMQFEDGSTYPPISCLCVFASLREILSASFACDFQTLI